MSPKPLDTVLLVDDTALDNKLHKRVIERTGLARNILTFCTAAEAIDYFRQPEALPSDLILLDINMPGMTGFEMLEAAEAEFGNDFRPSVVIMLTTSMNPRDRQRADAFSMVRNYFEKPLTPETFARLVEQVTVDKAAALPPDPAQPQP